MSIFELVIIEAVKGIQQFDKLKVDGKCLIDDFII